MTVKVRQLVKASGPTPPPPPLPPFMEFVQQPTTTQVGQDFVPPIQVSISNGASDSLTMSLDFGTCTIVPITRTAGPTGAIFAPLTALAVGNGCRFRVHNNTNPLVADILSNPFVVTPVPVIVTLEFSQQPTNTQTGQIITPLVEVTVSDGGNDSITVSGPCIAPQTATAFGGVATFSIAAGAVTTGCILTALSNTRPTIAPVQSDPFNVTAVGPINQVEITNGGNAFGFAQSSDGIVINASEQFNGAEWDSTGAAMRLYFVGNNDNGVDAANNRIREWVFGNWVDQPFTPTFPNAIIPNGLRLISDYILIPPSIAGPSSGFSVRPNGGGAPSTITLPVAAFFSLSGLNLLNPLVVAQSMATTTGATAVFPAPIAVNATGMAISLVISGQPSFNSSPAGYDNVHFLPVTSAGYSMAIAWKFGTFTTENPIWTFPLSPAYLGFALVVIRSV